MIRGRSWLARALVLGSAIAFLAWFFWPAAEQVEYTTARVERGDIVAAVKATGAVNPVSSVQVGTYVSGPIVEVNATYNSRVTRGERIARVDPRAYLVAVQSAEAAVATARARVDRVRAEQKLQRIQLDRQESLARSQIAARSELDIARAGAEGAAAEVKLAEASVAQAEAALADARVKLGYTEIISPVDGIVVSRNVDVGQTVAATFQTPILFVIAEDLSRMLVNAQVSEADIGSVREAQEATFSVDAYPGRSFAARVSQVRNAPQSLLNVVTYDVILAVDNSEGMLKPGMTASVSIVTAKVHDVLKAPLAALRFRPPADTAQAPEPGVARATSAPTAPGEPLSERVYRVRDQALEPVNVKTGLSDETTIEIQSKELLVGDEIVLRTKPPRTGAPAVLPGAGMGGSRRR